MTHAHATSAHDSTLTTHVLRWTGSTDTGAEPIDDSILARFLTPDDHDWTNDGAATWVAGHVSGLTYSVDGPTKRLVLHNHGAHDLAILSTPQLTSTDGSAFTYLPTATSAMLPAAQSHILQAERRDGLPILVGQILDDDVPQFLLDGPDVGDLDWASVDPDQRYWTPGDPDFGSTVPPLFRFVDPLTHGVHYTHAAGETVIHNQGDSPIAMATVIADGPVDFVVADPGESIPVPAGDAVHYVQIPRVDGDPTLLGVLWCVGGEVMPSALPIPSQRDHLDNRYLTPWSADWDCGYAQQIHLDPELAGVTFQYRTGADTMTIRNSGCEPVAVIYQRGTQHEVEEIAPYSRVTLPVRADADTGQVFSLVGRRVDGQPGRGAGLTSSGTVIPGLSARPGTATNYGSVVVMLGTVVYNAIPRKNLYLAWSDRRKWLHRNR